jgi:hypothetical protein
MKDATGRHMDGPIRCSALTLERDEHLKEDKENKNEIKEGAEKKKEMRKETRKEGKNKPRNRERTIKGGIKITKKE